MFLKSLVLRGFKTFADLVEIEFDDYARITAIVGPNGCGKSNVLDATRWVLGEDNPRELRVAGLSDIIFAGTVERKSLSLAEVSLIFDNSAGRIAVPFTEVSIKRRTFRDSESEFFINKNACRLKDIKDLLRDTGLGEGTYSIITQGQVDAILSSKSDERRLVFEEAAGINKYKSRKISAQKKLISAEQNILRINDLKIEVGEQLITLESQSKKAKAYLEIGSQVKETEIALSKKLLSSIFEKKQTLQEELDKLRKAAEEKKETEEKEVNEIQSLREQNKTLENEIEELAVKIEAEKDRLRDIELDRRFAESEIAREEKRLGDISREVEVLQEKISQLAHEMEQERKGFDRASVPFGGLVAGLLDELQKIVVSLSSLFTLLGGKPISLSFGSSLEKEETYKMKLEFINEEINKLNAEKENTLYGVGAHKAEIENLNAKLNAGASQQKLHAELSQKKSAKEQAYQKMIDLEERVRQEDKDERKSLGEETAIEIALAKLENEMNNIVEKLSLEYNLSAKETLAHPGEIANTAKAKKEVEEGRARLRAMEPVNLLAVEEFERAKERFSFIEAQLQDLSSARENLQMLIIELDQKAEQTFLETMNQLSVIFSETFAKLFAGGEAQITLAPGAPPLEAEIEISVRPSGRKWLPLSLLSGGERALSAIAILFSLLKIRPSPFCFLDEVDAALDEANIGRFTEMLRDFSNQSQIIVITHNKKTMAVADTIYGITMEEPGVSKVISMKLTQEIAIA
ncbi:MAG: AAA family ATPase [Candidatus Margulisbacteria bacterium]|nr:AAA family ATPase [Candidatus Margulisiibacteriota bacterium]